MDDCDAGVLFLLCVQSSDCGVEVIGWFTEQLDPAQQPI